jgi:hypothetical protein
MSFRGVWVATLMLIRVWWDSLVLRIEVDGLAMSKKKKGKKKEFVIS